jgi:predicted Zn finger-like uncharacterized protein
MRLVCPNCGAQYEVPDEVIPQGGRDVQCSSCGHTWFQAHPDNDRDLAEELQEPIPDPKWTPPAIADPERDEEDDDRENVFDDDWEDEHPSETPVPAPAVSSDAAAARKPARRELDPAVADLLRQEARAEQDARAAEAAAGIESQPDLGFEEPEPEPELDLNEGERRALEARQRMARMRGEPEPTAQAARRPATEAAAATALTGSRRDLLPDIDEINSTLRSSNERRTSKVEEAERASEASPRKRGGFRRGFLTVFVLAGVALAIYAYAPLIEARVPQAAPYLSGYVQWVDGLRGQLNDGLVRLLAWLDGMASTAGGGTEG